MLQIDSCFISISNKHHGLQLCRERGCADHSRYTWDARNKSCSRFGMTCICDSLLLIARIDCLLDVQKHMANGRRESGYLPTCSSRRRTSPPDRAKVYDSSYEWVETKTSTFSRRIFVTFSRKEGVTHLMESSICSIAYDGGPSPEGCAKLQTTADKCRLARGSVPNKLSQNLLLVPHFVFQLVRVPSSWA